MSQAATPEASPTKTALAVALIAGRVRSVRKYNGREGGVATVLVLPAPDEFTQPDVIEVLSPDELAEVGTIWRGKVRVGGYPKSYDTNREGANGELRKITVNTAVIQLHAV